MQHDESSPSELIYALEDTPPFLESLFAGLQHVLACFVGIVTPALVIGNILDLGEHIPYIISMALIVSGIGTFIQARKPFGIGAGMLCVQGTSFAFLGAIVSAGFIVKNSGGGTEQVLSMIFTLCFIGAFIQMVLSQFIFKLRKAITPLVTGIVITSIGVSLIQVGMTDLAGGFNAPDFGSAENLMLGLFVLTLIVVLNRSKNQWLRLSSIVIGLVAGFIVAAAIGKFSLAPLDHLPIVSLPVPFKYGFDFNISAFIPIALIYIITTIESTGDITANCLMSKVPITGQSYLQRVKGGVLADGLNSAIAGIFNTFPNTTFSQNNGVIQLTGIASRHIAIYVAVILVFLGLFPIIGGLLQQIPKPVLGGATLVMFGTVAAAGIKILATENLNRRNMLIIAVSFGVGLGIAMVPNVLEKTPQIIQNIFSSSAATGGLMAIILSLLLPEDDSTD